MKISDRKETVWAFDLGLASIGEAVRVDTEFKHVASLLIPAEFAETKSAAMRRRMMRTRLAHKAREEWLDTVWRAAGLEPLQKKKPFQDPKTKKWIPEKCQKADPRLEREFAAQGDETCYTSCLLRIKLLRGEKLEEWQIYKALHSAIQKRGYDKDIPWKTAEAKQAGKTLADLEKEEAKADAELAKKDPAYQAALNAWKYFKSTVDVKYHYSCYYDAQKMGLWNSEKPDQLNHQIDHHAESTRNVRFDRVDIAREIYSLAQAAGKQIPLLKDKENFLRYGPAEKAYASHDPVLRKEHGLHLGSKGDWQGVLGQKIPRFDNRIIADCALIPRLQVCRVLPKFKKTPPEQPREINPTSLLAAEVVFLMQAKNLQVDDGKDVRFLNTTEINDLLAQARTNVTQINQQGKSEAQILDCYKLKNSQWKNWCFNEERGLKPLTDSKGTTKEIRAEDTEDATEKNTSGKSQDVIKAPRPSGRSRFSRTALTILRHLLLKATPQNTPHNILEKLKSKDSDLLNELVLDVLDQEPLHKNEKGESRKGIYEKRPGPWILTSDLEFLSLVWKPSLGDNKQPLSYSPHQIRIPDLALRFLRKEHHLTEKPFADLLANNDDEIKRREKAILELVGEQNNPIVRDRLTRFWKRLVHFQTPTEAEKQKGLGLSDPQCLVLEFVRDDEDNSLDGKARKESIKAVLDKNEKERERIRKLQTEDGLSTSDDQVLKRMIWESQNCQCIYSVPNKTIGCTDYQKFELEHIIPRSLGGPDAIWNWVLADPDANAEKGKRIPYLWFKDEKTEEEWQQYKKRILDLKGKLGSRKVDLLLRSDALDLVGEKYTALADTAWISRLAQSIARLHFGWPLDDEPGKERVITISGGLTARIRRKYLLDSLLGPSEPSGKHTVDDPDPATLREQIDVALEELEKLSKVKATTDVELSEIKEKRQGLQQELRDLAAASSEKNRKDKRHHALDAMLLTFLPNWARDKNKEDFFRMEEIGDNPAYSETGRERKTAHQKRRKELYDQNKKSFAELKKAKVDGDHQKLESLKNELRPIRREIAVLYQADEKIKQPRNIRAVREWFKEQLTNPKNGQPVIPQHIARPKYEIEKTVYADRYLIQQETQRERIALCDFGKRPDFHDEGQEAFDPRLLRTQVQAIIGIQKSKDDNLCKALKKQLHEWLATHHEFTQNDWIDYCDNQEIRSFFPKGGGKKNTQIAPSTDCLLILKKIEILPTSRPIGQGQLRDLAYSTGTSLVSDLEELKLRIPCLAKRIEQPKKSKSRKGYQAPVLIKVRQEDCCPQWPNFCFDRPLQEKISQADFQQKLAELSKSLPGPKPKDKEAKAEWDEKKVAWDEVEKGFKRDHQLPPNLFIYNEGQPPREKSRLWDVLFRKVERQFSVAELIKQAAKITNRRSSEQIECFAKSLKSEPDAKKNEVQWKEFCEVWKQVSKQSWDDFNIRNPKPTADDWIAFYRGQSGSVCHKIAQNVGADLSEYADLSKDGTGQWFKGNNQGYLLAKRRVANDEEFKAFPVRFFEKNKDSESRLAKDGWSLIDSKPWQLDMLVELVRDVVTKPRPTKKNPNPTPKTVKAGMYFFGSISNETSVNLKSVFGEKVPQGISLKLLLVSGLRRVG